jgi:DNA polymerase III, alpha subunit
MSIKGLSVSGAEHILSEREKAGNFKNLEDFSRRVRLGRDDIIALCPAGAFDGISAGISRAMQARRLLSNNKEKKVRNGDLFSEEPEPEYNVNNIIPNTANELREEYNALGFLRRVHPLALWKEQIKGVKRIKALNMAEYTGRYTTLLGWPITQKEVWTKDGLTMSFLSFEDETALYETVLFPEIYDRYNKLLFDQQPLLVYGKVADDQGAVILEVRKIEVLGARTGQG